MVDASNDSKFQQFSDSVERCLRQFEETKEWQDIISCLAKLHRALLAYPQFNQIPHKLAVCKRLSQCLLPGLPGGIHVKVIDVYASIFKRIGCDTLAVDLPIYASGLFPLLSYASMQVRPILLDLYEEHLLFLGGKLIASLDGVFLAILPGLEENMEQPLSRRILRLLDQLMEVTDTEVFHLSLWTVVRDSHNYRFQALLYITHRLKGASSEQVVTASSKQTVVLALTAALSDNSVLVLRYTLDVLAKLFPFHAHYPLHFQEQTKLLSSSLQVLCHRDISLQRRVFAWMDGPDSYISAQDTISRSACQQEDQNNFQGDNQNSAALSYYCVHSCHYLKSVLSSILTTTPSSSPSSFPLKVAHNLLQQKHFKKYVFDDLFADIFLFATSGYYTLKKHNPNGKELMDFVFASKQVLHAIGPEYTFHELRHFLALALKALIDANDCEQLGTVLKLLSFAISENLWELNISLFKILKNFITNFMKFLKANHSILPAQLLIKCLLTLSSSCEQMEKLVGHMTRTPASTPCSPLPTIDWLTERSSICTPLQPGRSSTKVAQSKQQLGGKPAHGNVPDLLTTTQRFHVNGRYDVTADDVQHTLDKSQNVHGKSQQASGESPHTSDESPHTSSESPHTSNKSQHTTGESQNLTCKLEHGVENSQCTNTTSTTQHITGKRTQNIAEGHTHHVADKHDIFEQSNCSTPDSATECVNTCVETPGNHNKGNSSITEHECASLDCLLTIGEHRSSPIRSQRTATGSQIIGRESQLTKPESYFANVESQLTTGESQCTTGESQYTTGESQCTTGESQCTTGESQYTTGESLHATGESQYTAGESQHTTGESQYTAGESQHTTGESQCTTGESQYTAGESQHTTRESQYTAGESQHTTGESQYTTGESQCTTGESQYTAGESQHTTGESQYTTGESQCTTGESLYTTGESQHTTGESEHVTGESPHSMGESPHSTGDLPDSTGESPYTTGELPDSTGEPPHTTGELSHSTGESLHTTVELPHTSGELPHAAGELPHSTSESSYTTGELPHSTGESPHTAGEPPHSTGEPSHTTVEPLHTTGESPHITRESQYPTGKLSHIEPLSIQPSACDGSSLLLSPVAPMCVAYFEDLTMRTLELFSTIMGRQGGTRDEVVVKELLHFMTAILLSPHSFQKFAALFLDAHKTDEDSPQTWYSILWQHCQQFCRSEVNVALHCIEFYCKVLGKFRNSRDDQQLETFLNVLSSYEEKTAFYKTVVGHLWKIMATFSTHSHRCATAIACIHSLVDPLSVCEDFLLEVLLSTGPTCTTLEHLTTVLDSVVDEPAPGRPFRRCALECVAMLRSSSPGPCHWLVKEWISSNLTSCRCMYILEPVLCLIVDFGSFCHSCESQQGDQPPGEMAEQARCIQSITYSVTHGQCCAVPKLAKVVDCKRVLFAVSLVTSLLKEFSISLIKCLTQYPLSHVATSVYDGNTSPTTSPPSSLELLVTACVQLLRADYCRHSLSTEEDCSELLQVKVALCHLCSDLVRVFLTVPEGVYSGAVTLSSTYFVSLLTLCELQPTVLSIIGQWVEGWSSCTAGDQNIDPRFNVSSLVCLLLPSLHVLHVLAHLEAHLANPSDVKLPLSKMQSTPGSPFPEYNPGVPLVEQKLFWTLILYLLKISEKSETCGRLPAAVTCFLLSLLNVLQDILPSTLPTILMRISAIVTSAVPSSDDYSSSSDSLLYKLCLLSFLPTYYCVGLFQEYGFVEFSDFHTRVFCDPYIAQWKNHLALLARNGEKSSPLSPVVEAGSKPKGTLSWMFDNLFGRSQAGSHPPGVVKTVTGTPNVLIRVTPKVLESVITAWNMFFPMSSKPPIVPSLHDKLPSVVDEFKETVKRYWTVLSRDADIFVSIIVNLWMKWTSSAQLNHRDVVIDMLHTTKAIAVDRLLAHLKDAVITLGQSNEDGDNSKQEYLVHFLYKYMSSSSLEVQDLLIHHDVLVKFFADCLPNVSHYASLCLLTCTLHVVVCRCSGDIAPKERKNFQNMSRKFCEMLSRTAGVSAAQGFVWIQQNVTPSLPNIASHPEEISRGGISDTRGVLKDGARGTQSPDLGVDELQKPTIQALTVLSNVLPHFLDLLYTSADKDTVNTHLKTVLSHVWLHMKDYSSSGSGCHYLSVQLLARICQVEYTLKVWRKEAFECFTSKDFFSIGVNSLSRWMVVVDNLFTQDRQLFKQLLGGSFGLSTVSQIFSSGQDNTEWSRVVKCVSFVLFSGEVDQHTHEMVEIRQRLFECLQHFRNPNVVSSVLLSFRVLLIRCSYSGLKYIWPTLVYEVMSVLDQLRKDTDKGQIHYANVPVYISVCKLVEMMWKLSSLDLPQFHFIKWSFSVDSLQSALWKIVNYFKRVKCVNPQSDVSPSEQLLGEHILSLSSAQDEIAATGTSYSQILHGIVVQIKEDFIS